MISYIYFGNKASDCLRLRNIMRQNTDINSVSCSVHSICESLNNEHIINIAQIHF